ncbi:MAG: ABC transporter transmembrane domain-containing protein, partial [Promicromonosporaceae bacterium]|nr:ABC transporter transmembrane domain-containing protein [Promicromonosporaceae bacterium]
MRPLDPQLLRRAPAARGFVVLTATLTAVAAALVIGQALLIAWLVSGLVGQGLGLGDLPRGLVGLGALTFGRAAAAWAQERYALRAAASTISDLRGQLVAHTVALGPRGAGNSTTEVATLATRGLDALLPYLTRYLPALLSAALITPAAVAVLFGLDWVSAVLAIGMIPLVPLFMWLIGTMTRGLAARRLGVVERLGSQVL